MPGFGTETLRHLLEHSSWPREDLVVGLIGERPPMWRYLAAKTRFIARGRIHKYAELANSTLCSRDAEEWLRVQAIPWRWLRDDEEVCSYRKSLMPVLTLTLTSRVLFSAHTLQTPLADWFNVHPGLLPAYAGAVPSPYMFMDGVGGCSIHVMSERIDAGALVDMAPMQGPLGVDGGEYFFERLPEHTAARVALFIRRWREGRLQMKLVEPGNLRFCSSAKLRSDRQLDWAWPPDLLVRWVKALVPIAPAWWIDGAGRRIEVVDASVSIGAPSNSPGTLMRRDGRWVEVSCLGGAALLLCRRRIRAKVGSVLPMKPIRSV
jgi:methionyl-tRNA formyltransferase